MPLVDQPRATNGLEEKSASNTARPPLLFGLKAIDTCVLLTLVTPVIVGACGTVPAVTLLDAAEAIEVPLAFNALKIVAYEEPLAKADPLLCVVNVMGLVVPLAAAKVIPASVEY